MNYKHAHGKLSLVFLLLVTGLLMATLIFSGGSAKSVKAQPPDLEAIIQDLIDAFNAGDEACGELFTENGFLHGVDFESFGAVGRAGIGALCTFPSEDPAFELTLLSADASGSIVTGKIQLVEQPILDAGFDRTISNFTAQFIGDKIASLLIRADLTDPDTVGYIAFRKENPLDEDDGPPEGEFLILSLRGQQPGNAFLYSFMPGVTGIGLELASGTEDVLQPVHIHTGVCGSQGAIVFPLADVLNGASFTIFGADLTDLIVDGTYINVRVSEAVGDEVSCANIVRPANQTAYITGIPGVRALTINNAGNLVVGDPGTGDNDGRLLEACDLNSDGDAMDAGELIPIVTGLPSAIAGPPGEEGVQGLSGVDQAPNGTYWLVFGGGPPGLGVLGKVVGGTFSVVADLSAYEAANDPDGNGPDSNPYDVTVGGDGFIYATDAGGNDVLRVNPNTGAITTYAVLPQIPNPLFGQIGPPMMDTVPTGIEYVSQLDAIVVTFLSGFPFPQEGAGIYALFDNNGDGDARDPGEAVQVGWGLTMATDVMHSEGGAPYITEFTAGANGEPPSRLIQYSFSGATIIADTLIGATSVAITDSTAFVTQEFLGIVTMITNLPPTVVERSVELNHGWQLVTYTGSLKPMAEALASIEGDFTIAAAYLNPLGEFLSFDPNAPFLSNLSALAPGTNVWINVTSETPIILEMN